MHQELAPEIKIKMETVKCPFCHQLDWQQEFQTKDFLHGIPGDFYVSKCNSCDLFAQMPRPDSNSLALLYPSEYSPHQENRNLVEFTEGDKRVLVQSFGYQHLLETEALKKSGLKDLAVFDFFRRRSFNITLVPHYVSNGRALEVGCANGYRLRYLQRLGWNDVRGIEIATPAAEACIKSGLNVINAPVEDLVDKYEDNFFDTIISSMVIEHLQDPFAFIQSVEQKLKHGGQFLFSTVVRDGLDFNMYKKYWALFDLPRHMFFFKKQELQNVLQKKFKNIEFYFQPNDIDFLRSSRWRKSEGRLIDKFILNRSPRTLNRLAKLMALFCSTSRLSIRCVKA